MLLNISVKKICFLLCIIAFVYNYVGRKPLLSFNFNNVYSRILSDIEEGEYESCDRNCNLKYKDSTIKDCLGYYKDDTSGMHTLNGKDIISYLEEQNDNIIEDYHEGDNSNKMNTDYPVENYYNILNVDVYGDLSELQKNFYNLSLKYYPKMRNENLFELNKKFEELSEAYQVLNYKNRKDIYDNEGISGIEKMNIIHPVLYFNGIFIFDMMYQYIGTTEIGYIVRIFLENNISSENIPSFIEEINKNIMDYQIRREEELTELLKKRLDLYMDNDEQWKNIMGNEINLLSNKSFSNIILESIGWTYENVSNIYIEEIENIGNIYHGIYMFQANERKNKNEEMFDKSKNHIHSLINIFYPYNEQINPLLKRAQLNRTNVECITSNRGNKINAEYDALYNETVNNISNKFKYNLLNDLLISILYLNLYDIEETVRNVADVVLRDNEVDVNIRSKRAHRMRLLGSMILQKINV
ncbi:gametocyte erythrocyte cytosolic protein [Plasmodium gaboni]|uniref:Gametocyte erythrocyte cytosolic protein n=1 Tax=Plasmodium gaboni TaxID=647221 RepID=A0A151L3H1_9APIC|nr:gametocyte erythrocyte cytosolic protein [Plasmodium gaboni]KYN93387.1 gametocyte erythrocyte cytosolic protein [Plasmodium gaboni]